MGLDDVKALVEWKLYVSRLFSSFPDAVLCTRSLISETLGGRMEGMRRFCTADVALRQAPSKPTLPFFPLSPPLRSLKARRAAAPLD